MLGSPLLPTSMEKIGHGVSSWRNLQAKSQRQHPPKAGFAHRAGGLGERAGRVCSVLLTGLGECDSVTHRVRVERMEGVKEDDW